MEGLTEALVTLDSFNAVYSLLDKKYQRLPEVIKERERLYDQQKALEMYGKLVGGRCYDFELKALDGTVRRISDYVGKSKYLMIDFWTSWSVPCIVFRTITLTGRLEKKDIPNRFHPFSGGKEAVTSSTQSPPQK